VALPVSFRCEVLFNLGRQNVDLICNKRNQLRRWNFTGTQWPAGVAQIAKHQGVTEPVMIAAASPDQRKIGW
jgi:transposase